MDIIWIQYIQKYVLTNTCFLSCTKTAAYQQRPENQLWRSQGEPIETNYPYVLEAELVDWLLEEGVRKRLHTKAFHTGHLIWQAIVQIVWFMTWCPTTHICHSKLICFCRVLHFLVMFKLWQVQSGSKNSFIHMQLVECAVAQECLCKAKPLLNLRALVPCEKR